MKRSDLKELIKKSMLEVSPKSGATTLQEKDKVKLNLGLGAGNKYQYPNPREDEDIMPTDAMTPEELRHYEKMMGRGDVGAMTPEEEEMVAGYEEEEANKYALDKEEPMEEGSVTLNRDEVYAKYAPLVKQYMASGLGRHAAISKAQNVLAKEYGATPLNIQSTISDYFDDQDRNATYANEDVLREADEIVAAYAEKKTLNEEMYGGYLELFEMNPNFEEGVSMLLTAWEEWKEGPMTEPEMVEEAKQDVLAYLSSMMR
jgi:hypothetical protein